MAFGEVTVVGPSARAGHTTVITEDGRQVDLPDAQARDLAVRVTPTMQSVAEGQQATATNARLAERTAAAEFPVRMTGSGPPRTQTKQVTTTRPNAPDAELAPLRDAALDTYVQEKNALQRDKFARETMLRRADLTRKKLADIYGELDKKMTAFGVEHKAKFDQLRQREEDLEMKANAKMDPGRWLRNTSTGQRIGLAIAHALELVSAGLNPENASSTVAQRVREAIDEDIRFQQYEVEQARAGLSRVDNAFQQLRDLGADEHEAYRIHRSAAFDLAKIELDQIATEEGTQEARLISDRAIQDLTRDEIETRRANLAEQYGTLTQQETQKTQLGARDANARARAKREKQLLEGGEAAIKGQRELGMYTAKETVKAQLKGPEQLTELKNWTVLPDDVIAGSGYRKRDSRVPVNHQMMREATDMRAALETTDADIGELYNALENYSLGTRVGAKIPFTEMEARRENVRAIAENVLLTATERMKGTLTERDMDILRGSLGKLQGTLRGAVNPDAELGPLRAVMERARRKYRFTAERNNLIDVQQEQRDIAQTPSRGVQQRGPVGKVSR